MTDTFDQITADCDETPLLYATVLATLRQLSGTGRTTQDIGLVAWAQLDTDERRTALSALLESYASRVAHEQAEQAHQAAADNPTISTCLAVYDIAAAWDSVASHTTTAPEPHETIVDRQTLINLLSEIDMLRRRAAADRP